MVPTVYIRLMAISAIAISIVVDPVSAQIYYASPKGGGDGSSVESPFAVGDFWDDAQPGDTLILLNGLYTGPKSMIKPPENLSGTQDVPITIRAMRDGKVTIDGKGVLRPITLHHNDWWVIEGINACNSKSTVVGLSRSNYCIVRRMCGWNAADGNLTAIGGLKPEFGRGDISNTVEVSDKKGPAAWQEMFRKETPERGAHLYYRYVNGKLTDKPLWPWPMNDRIKELTGVDLTATINGLAQ